MASLEAQKREVANLLLFQGHKQGSRSRRLKSINPLSPHDLQAKLTHEVIQDEKRLRNGSITQQIYPGIDGVKERTKEKSLFHKKRHSDQGSVCQRRQIKKFSSIAEEMEQTGKGENKLSVDHFLEHDPLSGTLHPVYLKIINTYRVDQPTSCS